LGRSTGLGGATIAGGAAGFGGATGVGGATVFGGSTGASGCTDGDCSARGAGSATTFSGAGFSGTGFSGGATCFFAAGGAGAFAPGFGGVGEKPNGAIGGGSFRLKAIGGDIVGSTAGSVFVKFKSSFETRQRLIFPDRTRDCSVGHVHFTVKICGDLRDSPIFPSMDPDICSAAPIFANS
jgi:hypothetical protein